MNWAGRRSNGCQRALASAARFKAEALALTEENMNTEYFDDEKKSFSNARETDKNIKPAPVF